MFDKETSSKIKIKIKDKKFILNTKKSITFYGILKNDIKGSIYNKEEKIWEIPSYSSNFEILSKYIKNESFHKWYNELKEKKVNNTKNTTIPTINDRHKLLKEKYNELKEKYPLLYDFQLKAILKSIETKHGGILLSLDPGLGKTVTALIVSKEKKSKNVWVVCPASLQDQWKFEIKKWLNNFDIVIYNGSKKKREQLYENPGRYNIISYETLRNDISNPNLMHNLINCFLIADESSKLKNNKSLIYKTFKKLVPKVNFQMYLTGTPVTNNLFDINNTIKLIDSKLIRNVKEFCVYEERRIGWGHNAKIFNELVGYKNLEVYVQKIKPVYIRKNKQEVADQLPKRNIISYNIEQHDFLHDVKEMVINEIGPFSGFSLLQMLECGFPVFNNSDSESVEKIKMLYEKLPSNITKQINYETMPDKVERLIELVEEINRPIIIFTHYQYSALMLEKWLNKKIKNKVIKSTLTNNKTELKEEFIIGKVDIVVATDTWSHGVSLSNIDYLINYDLIPSLETYLQRIERIYRIDSKNTKFVYNLVGDIIEDLIMNILSNKLELFDKIVEGKAGMISDTDIKKEVIKKIQGNLKRRN